MNAPIIINHVQHSAEWHAHRASHYNASDAPAMLGLSPHMTRAALVERYARGVPEEIDAATQARFDRGHEYEATARPWAEEIIGEELYPVTIAQVIDGLKLSASLDGLTLAGDIAWEHKTLNLSIREALWSGDLAEHHKAQMEQQLMVSGAEKCLFMASNGEKETALSEWYESDPAMRSRIIAGWKQFARDVANYTPTTTTPAPVATPIQALPALLVEIEGRVVSTNLDRFKTAAKALIGAIKTDLSTDQDFADAEATVKFCKDAEGRLETVKAQALSQTATIDEVFRVMDALKEELRAKRLVLEKAVKIRKDEVRAELITSAMEDLLQHTRILEAEMGNHWLNVPARQTLGEAIKGRKSVSSCRDALAVKVGEMRAELSSQAARLTRNRAALCIDGRDWYSLFPDFTAVGLRGDEEFDAIAELRIRKHLEAETEAARLKAEAKARAEAEHQAACAEIGRLEHAAQAAPAPAPTATPTTSAEQPPAMPSAFEYIEWHPAIEAFLASREFGNDASFVRATLKEFAAFVLGFKR